MQYILEYQSLRYYRDYNPMETTMEKFEDKSLALKRAKELHARATPTQFQNIHLYEAKEIPHAH